MTTWPISLPNTLTNGTLADAVQVMADLNALLNGINDYVGKGAGTQSTPANPTGTTSMVGVMMGLAGTFTPATTGRMQITITGNASSNTNNGGATFQIRTGTGAAPANAAALTGTARGVANSAESSSSSDFLPFCAQAIVSSLTLGTAYWIDLSLAAATGGTALLKNLVINAVEF